MTKEEWDKAIKLLQDSQRGGGMFVEVEGRQYYVADPAFMKPERPSDYKKLKTLKHRLSREERFAVIIIGTTFLLGTIYMMLSGV